MTVGENLAVEEFKSLNHKLDLIATEGRLLVRLSLTSAAAIYAWLAVNVDSGVAKLGWYIPIFIPILGVIYNISHSSRTLLIAQYMRENIDTISDLPGWETYVYTKRKEEPFKQQLVGWSYGTFWFVFFLGTIVITYVMTSETTGSS